MNIHFRALWLATQARDILWYPLVCKTHLTRARMITFQPSFDKTIFFFCHWLFTGLLYTKTIIHLSVGEYLSEYLSVNTLVSPLQGSVNIHRYSPTLRWIIVNYNLPWSAIPSFSFNVMETVRDRKMRGDHWKSWTSSIEWNWISVWKYRRQRLENLIFHSFVQFHSMEMFSVVRKYSWKKYFKCGRDSVFFFSGPSFVRAGAIFPPSRFVALHCPAYRLVSGEEKGLTANYVTAIVSKGHKF